MTKDIPTAPICVYPMRGTFRTLEGWEKALRQPDRGTTAYLATIFAMPHPRRRDGRDRDAATGVVRRTARQDEPAQGMEFICAHLRHLRMIYITWFIRR